MKSQINRKTFGAIVDYNSHKCFVSIVHRSLNTMKVLVRSVETGAHLKSYTVRTNPTVRLVLKLISIFKIKEFFYLLAITNRSTSLKSMIITKF